MASSRSPKSLEFLRMIQKSTSIPLTSFEIMNNNSIKTVLKNIDSYIANSGEADWYILIEFSYEKVDAIDKINEIVNLGLEKKIISNAVFANSKNNQSKFGI